MNEELKATNTRIPVQREELAALATAVKLAGPDYIYPRKIGDYTVGDAHWATLIHSKMHDGITLKNTIEDAVSSVNGNSVALLGGRFISWVLAKELDKYVDEIIISDTDPWVQKMTVDNLQGAVNATVIAGENDKSSANAADDSIITTTVPQISKNILNTVPNAFNLV